MTRQHPDFSTLTPEEMAILFGPSPSQQAADDQQRRDRARQRVLEAVAQEGMTLEEVFGPAFAQWSNPVRLTD